MSGQQTEGGLDGGGTLVSEPKRLQLTSGQKIGVAALVALVFLAFIWIDVALQHKDADKQPELASRPTASAFRPAPITLPPQPEPVVQQVKPPPPAPTTHEISPAESPIFAYSGTQLSGAGASVAAEPRPQMAARMSSTSPIVPSLNPGASEGGNALASRLKPTVLEGVKAALLPHPDMLITKGTIISCTLQTAINTELAGYVKCVLPEAVRGTTGNVVLLDRGTTIVGEIQSGLVQGQERVFILWDRAETPDHAVVTLASPGADELGAAGVPGAVDDHFWKRFGNAILLSVIQGALQAGAGAASESGSRTGNYFNNFQSSGEQMADTSLKASINIPPTLVKNQGDNVSIFVARDIDFSGVYSLRLVRKPE